MKIKWKSERFEIEVENPDIKDCFAELASAIEVFTNNVCGNCDSPQTVPVVRENQGNTFYEMSCRSCGASLGFGQRRSDGALFPKKKKDGRYLDNNGWLKWQPRESEDSPAVKSKADVPF